MRSYLDFTYDPVAYAGLPEFVASLHAQGMHYTMITGAARGGGGGVLRLTCASRAPWRRADPGISNTQSPGSYPPYDQGTAHGVWINNSAGAAWVGGVWPGATVFADFFGPATYDWWRDQIAAFHAVVPFDGLWIDMNEVSVIVQEVQCGTGPLVTPPYMYVPRRRRRGMHGRIGGGGGAHRTLRSPSVADGSLSGWTMCTDAVTSLGPTYNTHSL